MSLTARCASAIAVALLALPAAAAHAAPAAGEAGEGAWRVFTVAGDGWTGDTVEGVPATATPAFPADVAATPDGDLLFSSVRSHRVFAVAPSGVLRVVAGDGSAVPSGDGGPATAAGLGEVGAIAALPDGGFVLADGPVALDGAVAPVHPRIRRVAPDGTITTIAGSDVPGFSGDGGPGAGARFGDIVALTVRPADGSVLAVDAGAAYPSNQRVRRIWPDGIVTTVAGTGKAGYSGDGGPAAAADLQDPSDVSVLPDGGFLIADALNHRVRRVAPAGTITTVAGDGRTGPAEDGLAAVRTQLDGPRAVEAAADGGFWVADQRRIRRVGADGVIRSVTSAPACRHDDITGPGNALYAGDGRQARCAAVVANALAATADGDLLVADANRTVRLLSAGGRGHPAVAITSTAVHRSTIQLNVLSTFGGVAQVQVLRGRQVVSTGQGLVPPGWGTVAVPRPATAGVYDVRLTVLGLEAGAAAAEVGLQVGTLAEATARQAIRNFFAQTTGAETRLGPCRRFSAARIDCRQVTRGPVGPARCTALLSVQVRGSGLAAFRAYNCPVGGGPLFRVSPRWNVAEWPQRWPPLLRRGLIPAPLLAAD